VLVSAGNAASRYVFSIASNAWLELQWYLFAAVFLLCSGYTLRHNEHIRIDVIAGNLSRRAQMWIDIFGTLFFLLPMAAFVTWLSWPIFMNAWNSNEISGSAGGSYAGRRGCWFRSASSCCRLQGLSELIKRIAFLKGLIPDPLEKHEVPLELAIARRSSQMTQFLIAYMAPLMFAALVVFLLIGYPVSFALAAIGLSFGFLGIELGLLTPALFGALPERIFGIMSNDTLLAVPFFTSWG